MLHMGPREREIERERERDRGKTRREIQGDRERPRKTRLGRTRRYERARETKGIESCRLFWWTA